MCRDVKITVLIYSKDNAGIVQFKKTGSGSWVGRDVTLTKCVKILNAGIVQLNKNWGGGGVPKCHT